MPTQERSTGAKQPESAAKESAKSEQVAVQKAPPRSASPLERAERSLRRLRRRFFAPSDVSPFEAMRRMSDDIDRVLTSMSSPDEEWFAPFDAASRFLPEVDVFEEGDELVVRADVPGLKKEDLRVEIFDGNLVIEGERRSETERKGRGYYRAERSYGEFRRAIPLPENVLADQVSASFDSGVLEIRVKQAKREGKRIEITTPEKPEVH